MWYDGGGLEKLRAGASPIRWSYWYDVIGNAKHTIIVFDCAAFFGLCLAIFCAGYLANFSRKNTLDCLWLGLAKSVVPCLILSFAWSLQNCCKALHTDAFLVALLVENVSINYLPALVFVVACLTSFTTGTSWGTMAILIPIVGPVAFQMEGGTYGLITMMSLGAVLDGSIFGDHCSPISDTTILSSSASQCDLMQHVRTQIPYSILGAAIALMCGYLPVAVGFVWISSLAFGIVAIIAFFFLFGSRTETPLKESS
jgi:Na+/H+ antiporter NhaC